MSIWIKEGHAYAYLHAFSLCIPTNTSQNSTVSMCSCMHTCKIYTVNPVHVYKAYCTGLYMTLHCIFKLCRQIFDSTRVPKANEGFVQINISLKTQCNIFTCKVNTQDWINAM